ncbi:MAG: hypothetical protein WDM81_05745 [Rhizomicrobium sp.]
MTTIFMAAVRDGRHPAPRRDKAQRSNEIGEDAEPIRQEAGEREGEEEFGLADENRRPGRCRERACQRGGPRDQAQHQEHRRQRPVGLGQGEGEGDPRGGDHGQDEIEIGAERRRTFPAGDRAVETVERAGQREEAETQQVIPVADVEHRDGAAQEGRDRQRPAADPARRKPRRHGRERAVEVAAKEAVEHGNGLLGRASTVKLQNRVRYTA